MLRTLVFSSVLLNLGLLLGRVSGFVREAVVAGTYGVSAEADVLVLMLTVPDILVSILMGGALGAVLIPRFTQDPGSARALLYQCMLVLGLVFVLIASLLFVFMEEFLALLAPGFDPLRLAKSANAVAWVIWLVPLTVLSGATTAYLQAHNRFGIAAMGTLIINCTIIPGLLLSTDAPKPLFIVALSVLVGGVLRLISQVLPISIRWRPLGALKPVLTNRKLAYQYLQAMMSGSMLILFPVVARAFASFEDEGSVAVLNYALRLVEFPLLLAVTFLATVLFPTLSGTFSRDTAQHQFLIVTGVRLTLVLSLLSMLLLVALSLDYTTLVYGYGEMSDDDLTVVASIVAIGLFSLPLQGFAVYMTTVFNSRGDTRTPVYVNATGLMVFCALGYAGLVDLKLESILIAMIVGYSVICAIFLLVATRGQLLVIGSLASVRELLVVGLTSGVAFIGVSSLLANRDHPLLSLSAGAVVGLLAVGLLLFREPGLRSVILKEAPSFD